MNIVNQIITNQGATINKNLQLVNLKTGYQVSKQDLQKMPLSEFNNDIVVTALKCIKKRGEYLGIWIEKDIVYIDISQRIPNKKQAIDVGRKYNQISIFQWNKKECVYC